MRRLKGGPGGDSAADGGAPQPQAACKSDSFFDSLLDGATQADVLHVSQWANKLTAVGTV